MDEPVGIRPLRILIKDRIEDITVDIIKIIAAIQKDQVVGQKWYTLILMKGFKIINEIMEIQTGTVLMLKLCTPVPDILKEQKKQGQDDRYITADKQLSKTGNEEHSLNHAKDDQNDP